MKFYTRVATKADIGFVEQVENECFDGFQKSSRRSLHHALSSMFQNVFIIHDLHNQIGVLILMKYTHTVRIYSVGILKKYRKKGSGSFAIDFTKRFAAQHNLLKIILEADTTNKQLISWYNSHGFVIKKTIPNYYADGKSAYKLEHSIFEKAKPFARNIIVSNHAHKWQNTKLNARIISVKDYISNPEFQAHDEMRVFNLCSSYKYQSYGYYISLLAGARGQKVIPSATTIRDFKIAHVIRSISFDIEQHIQKSLSRIKNQKFQLKIYFGQTTSKGFQILAKQLFKLFEAPMFEVQFIYYEDNWIIKNIKVLSLSNIPEEEHVLVFEMAEKFFNKKHYKNTKLTNYKYDLAILVDPNEKTPPSCPIAIQKFRDAAHRKGIYTELIQKQDIDKINEFDALFIRETTNVNDHTYEFSRMAYAEGLVVIDDPWSIVKCSNKIYQHELFKKHGIRTPQTNVFTKNVFSEKQLDSLEFPLVLKQPDSAFSVGIEKVDTKAQAIEALNNLFKKSDMIVSQEFLYSEFDWRIGILDNKVLYACKYYMSRNHWQIYNWTENAEETSGDSETLPLENVPAIVLKTARKAASLIGDGFYGVDLKQINDKVYVIEVNDNPSIDAGIEDAFLGDALYDEIITSIYTRIEVLKNVKAIEV